MVVSHRESSISSNIRAIIEQLNLNPVERRRLIESRVDEIDRSLRQHKQPQVPKETSISARVTIGVYGLRQQVEDKFQSCRKALVEQQFRQRKVISRKLGEARPRQRIPPRVDIDVEHVHEVPRKDAPTPSSATLVDTSAGISPPKEDLPEPTSGQLSHTAALHRISVRPKNRRPPRRSSSSGAIASDGPAVGPRQRVDSSISENSIDTLDSLEGADSGLAVDSPEEASSSSSSSSSSASGKPTPVVRKSSSRLSRLSRNSEAFEEPGAGARAGAGRKAAVSPDSLEANLDGLEAPKASPRSASLGSEAAEGPPPRRGSTPQRLSKSPDSLERERSPGWLGGSSEGLGGPDGGGGPAAAARPVPARRLLLKPISKSQERVCCGRGGLEAGPGAGPARRLMSKSTESFDSTLREQRALVVEAEGAPKRASLSEINLSRAGGYGRAPLSCKSSDSLDELSSLLAEARRERERAPDKLGGNWRPSRRLGRSSEGSDNLDLEESCRLENRSRPRRQSTPKRLSAASLAGGEEQEAGLARPRRPEARGPHKSSESSELGSTDTLDSERRSAIKSSDSDETLDSLEKELPEQDEGREDAAADGVLEALSDEHEDDERLASAYWRRRANSHESKESGNLDIHQLLAYSLVSRIQENGNGDDVDDNHRHDQDDAAPKTLGSAPLALYPKKKPHQLQTQQQSSSEENKTLTSTISNILSSKTDEDLQNMLNGNISEVSTDTKSFKEKLIMFEKLGK